MSAADSTHLRSDAELDDGAGPVPNAPDARPRRPNPLLAGARNLWRQLTSMRVALILLFLLALASLPGALLPQWTLNQNATAQFIVNHPTLGPLLDRLGFFGVFASPWYAAIYLALFASLIGCLMPRTRDYVRALRAKPVPTPRQLSRLPHHAAVTVSGDVTSVAARISGGLRGWRRAGRTEIGGVSTISAEKGFSHELGNLVFHYSLVGLLAAVAVGKMFGFEGSTAITEGSGFCSGSPIVYSTFRPGLLVDGTELAHFCVDVQDFTATYTDEGQASDFTASIRYQNNAEAATGTWTSAQLKVNEPIRIDGERVYLLGHGYAPEFTVTFPNGEVRTGSQIFQPTDPFLLSEGAVKFLDPPGYTGAAARSHQLALVGLFAPTAAIAHNIMSSAYPGPTNPGVAIQVYRGDLGMDDGASQSIFQIDQSQVDSGALQKLTRANLAVGESMTLDDGTVITFTGFKEWVQLQTSYDPAQGWALLFAVTLLLGLMLSLLVTRRRVWFRISPAAQGSPGRCQVEIGGLARTDQAGYGGEFDTLVQLAGVKGTAEGPPVPE